MSPRLLHSLQTMAAAVLTAPPRRGKIRCFKGFLTSDHDRGIVVTQRFHHGGTAFDGKTSISLPRGIPYLLKLIGSLAGTCDSNARDNGWIGVWLREACKWMQTKRRIRQKSPGHEIRSHGCHLRRQTCSDIGSIKCNSCRRIIFSLVYETQLLYHVVSVIGQHRRYLRLHRLI